MSKLHVLFWKNYSYICRICKAFTKVELRLKFDGSLLRYEERTTFTEYFSHIKSK